MSNLLINRATIDAIISYFTQMKKLRSFSLLILLCFLSEGIACEQWVQRANFGGEGRHRCTGFSIGNKGYIGGGRINSGVEVFHEDYWQYDPGSDTWTQIADYGGGKRFHAVAFSIGDFAYVGCGEDEIDLYHNDFYRYVPQLNIWQPIASLPGATRRGAASFVINNQGYVGTGQSNGGYEVDFYRYDPDLDQWFSIQDFLGEARSSAVGFSENGIGYVGTGHVWGNHTKDFYAYDPLLDSWTQKSDVGTTFRQDATGFVIDGKGYIGTGNDVDGNINYKDFWQYDFTSDTWVQIEDFCGEGRRYMVSFVIDGKAFAGTGTDGTNLRDFYMFDPLLSITDLGDYLSSNVFPNPSSDEILIDFPGLSGQLSIYNMQSQLILHEKFSNQEVIQKSDFGEGVFSFVIATENHQVYQGKIIFN
jgi:N-acetylneuraminic acid mutarotase